MHASKFIIVFGYTIFGNACIKTDMQINSDLGNFKNTYYLMWHEF